ncbi:hypothetical protein CVN68_11565 [Sphingomonas psychrotolerans]|uniref:Uncharacterized protein n=1 Tax=Sphingomonas psychrotolerans TaxID=1327635 RepID=A0A2K8MF68_9SPHN|nr:hypothetical protein CVN68_11565 [Sphingomonas psychrotolerans]
MVDPNGELSEGNGVPEAFTHGSESDAAECVRAAKVYLAVRRRWRSDAHIKRAVRMLGRRTADGWTMLRLAR